jgi:hypothetical protein
MKKTLFRILSLIIILFTFSSISLGQVRKLRSLLFSSKYKFNEYSWSDWSEPTESNVLKIIDIENERITIYSQQTQIYDIVEYEGETTDSDGDDFMSFFCVNADGLTCRIRLAKLNAREEEIKFM